MDLRQIYRIYANSYLNICANWGYDSSTGLFHMREPTVDSWASLGYKPNSSG